MTTAELPSILQASITEIVERSKLRNANIQAILLSTTDGAPLGRGYCTIEDEDAVAAIESTPHCKHMSLLGMGGVRQVTALYDHGTLIHVVHQEGAMVVTLLCDPQANLGAVRSAVIPLLLQVLEPFATKLGTSLTGVAEGGATYYQ